MQIVRDSRGKVVCRADGQSGTIETKYQKMTVRIALSVGEYLTIERDGTVTKITRQDQRSFRVEHLE